MKIPKSVYIGVAAAAVCAIAFMGGRWYERAGDPVAASQPGSAPARMFDRQDTKVKIMFVGLDALDWQVADPLMAAGRMPNLRRLKEHGRWGRMRSISPMLSVVLWTSIGTGKEPAKHGILDFIAQDQAGKTIPVTSNFRTSRAIWNIFSDAGLKVGVVGWWATWPAETVDGYVVTDKLAYQLFGLGSSDGTVSDQAGMVYPDSLYGAIKPLVVNKQDITMDTVRRFLDLPQDWDKSAAVTADDRERVDLFRGYIAQAESYRRIGVELHKTQRPDIDLVYFESPDEVGHMFMCFRPPRLDWVDPIRVGWFGQAMDRYYEEMDRYLGEFMEAAQRDGAAIVVCSDHGFRNAADRPNTDSRIGKGGAADWHRKYGVVVFSGGPFGADGKEIEEASVLDVAPTLLAALGIPIGKDMDGQVLDQAFDPSFLQKYPVRTIASHDGGSRAAAATGGGQLSHVEQDQLDALAALGYIDDNSAAAPGGETQEGPNYHNNKGTVLMQEGKYDEAIAEYRLAIEASPTFYGARQNLARAYHMKGDLAQAQDILEALIQERGPEKMVLHELARIEMDQKSYAKAEGLLRQAISLDPNSVEARNSLAELLEITGRYDEAIAENKKCVEIDPDNEQGYNNIGNVYKRLGNLQEAEAWYRKAIKADSEFPGSYNNLGLVLQDMGRLAEAEAQYKTALEKYSTMGAQKHEYAVVLNSIGTLYCRRAESDQSWWPKAKQKFQEALQEDPNYPEAHNNLGVILGREGRQQEEMREYETAVRLEPRYADGQLNLARAYLRQGQLDKALDPLRLLTTFQPSHMLAHVLIGNIMWQKGDTTGALAAYDQALRVRPTFLPGIVQKEKLLTQLNRLAEAAQVIDGALIVHPAERILLSDLYALYTRLGKTAEAARIKARLDALGPAPAGPGGNPAS